MTATGRSWRLINSMEQQDPLTAKKALITALSNRTIWHQQASEARDRIAMIHALSGYESAGMMLIGHPGLGKTRILEGYMKRYAKDSAAEVPEDDRSVMPVLLVRTPEKPNTKTVISAILKELRHVILERTRVTAAELRAALITSIQQQRVSLILFDEFQHLLRDSAKQETIYVLNLIKTLMDETKVAMVMTGIPSGYEALKQHEELKQRFSAQIYHLQPFSVASVENVNAYKSFIKTVVKLLDAEGFDASVLTTDHALNGLLLASSGIPRNMIHLLRTAILHADLAQPLSLGNLRTAYKLTNNSRGKPNPFSMPTAALQKEARHV